MRKRTMFFPCKNSRASSTLAAKNMEVLSSKAPSKSK